MQPAEIDMTKKVGPGRPKKPLSAKLGQVAVRFPAELLAEVDALSAARLDRPDRSSVVRELVAEALLARKRRGKV